MQQYVFPLISSNTSDFMSGELSRVSALRANAALNAETLPPTLSVAQWIDVMTPHVREEVAPGHHKAQLAAGDSLGILAGSSYASLAELSCAVFNALPLDLKQQVGDDGVLHPYDIHADSVCTPAGRYVAYWWGFKWYMNHCLVTELTAIASAGGGAAGIAAALTAACPVAAIVLGIVAGYLAIYSGALVGCDGHCTQGGAYLNATWASIGTPWCSAVC